MIRHSLSGGDGTRLAKGLKMFAAAEMLQVGVGDYKVGGEHGSCDLAAVCAVADEGVNQAGALCWL